MYLKRLEIQGFKSFADKVEFEFPSGITAIVGPNGSGKSNVVDSIRWVLGEQSVKSLRGSKMEDVIFAGSSDRRPVGMAQVSMTIDNSEHLLALDFDEITVTRRLYRSGESEYLINKSPCRLKDIHELFMDTGLGREGLSIISQGKVDEILTLKPEDRRGLIEEAAGIVKYKYRKREAERKLADTEENMVRIHDIISELSERVGPLGEQAEKAKQYKVWKEDLDKLEISVETADIEKNKTKETQLLSEKENIENQAAEQASQLAKKEALLSEEKFAEQADEEEMGQLQQQFFTLQGEIDRRKNDITAAKEMVNHVDQQKEILQKDIAAQQDELKSLQEQINNKQGEAEESKGKFAEEEKQLNDLQAQVNRDGEEQTALEQNIETIKNQQFVNMQEQARIHNEIQSLNQELSGGDRRQERQAEKLQNLEQQLSEAAGAAVDLQETYEEQLTLQEKHLRKIESLEQELENRKQEQFLMQKALNDIQMRYQEAFSKKEALTELEHSGDGYQYGVKSILEQKNEGNLDGIIGTVAQLIKVPQKYEKAVETAMGVSLQNIVTENDSQAQKAIQYLKEHKKGRVTFLPLNTVKGMRAEEDLSNEQNVIGLAVDLIEFEDRYQQILLHLLGKVWIVKDLGSAVNIGKKRGFSHRLVTLDGELITPGGALTGGNHNKEQKGLLLRQRQIEELAQQVIDLHQKMDDKNQELDDFYLTTNEKQQQLNNLKEERTEFVQQVAALHQQLEQNAKEQKRLASEQKLEQENLAEMLQEKEQAVENLKNAQHLEKELKEQEDSLKEKIAELQEKQQEHLQAAKLRQEELHNAHIKFATAKQRWEIMEQQYLEVETRAEQLQETIKQKEENYQNLLEQHQNKQQEIVEHQKYIEEHLPKLQAENEQLELKKSARTQRREALQQLEDAIKDVRKNLGDVNEKKYRLEMELNRVQGFLGGAQRRLEQNFGMTFEQALAVRIEIPNWNEAQKQIQTLKTQLRSLGEINFTAIEEYEQVKERLTFLSAQVADLQEAKQSLNKVIQEMEKIMAKKFEETYHEVNAHFSDMFQAMFGGGKARLELSDPEDYLLTGIEIIAQPPGKKEQVLTLLSGGERAMTAIALLLSLLSVKPSPFCILDEIESALDDANVDRFAQFIKAYSEKTQFLVISHRKGTMEAADTLFGVTIEDKGVSRLMSVKMSDYE